MMNKNHELRIIVTLVAVVVVTVMLAVLIPTTTETPTVEMGVEVADDDWRITESVDGRVHVLEMYAPAYANQKIVVEYDNDRVAKNAGKYGFIMFAVPLNTEKVVVVT